MTIAIKPLRKFSTGTPTTSDMVEGELAVNTADQKIFMRDDSNNIVQVGGVGGSVTIGESAPGTPSAGDLWWDSTDNDANLKIYYVDGNSTAQWVTATVAGGGVSGANTQIQFNNSGKFGASGNLTFNGSTLAVTGNVTASGGVDKVTIVATNSTDAAHFLTFVDTATGNEEIRTDTGLTFNPNSNTLTTTTFSGALSGEATTAVTATNVTSSANDSTSETVYLTFVDGQTGAQGIETDVGLIYNPSSGVLQTTSVTGNLTGAVTGNADTATEATNITAVANNSTDETCFVTFIDGQTGTQGIEAQNNFTFNPSSGLLSTSVLVATTNIRCGDGGTIGSATTNDAMTISSSGIVTFKDDIKIKDVGTIGNASVADILTLTAAGEAQFKDDVELVIDGKDLKFGANTEIRLRHVHDTGLELRQSSTNDTGFVLTFNALDTEITAGNVLGKIEFKAGLESGGTDAILPGAFISAVSEGTFAADNNATKLSFGTGASETAAEKMSLSSGGNLSLHQDAAVINFGADADIQLTHVHNQGLLLTETGGGQPTLRFYNASESISSNGSRLILQSNAVNFNMPTADGSADHVLKTDGAGNLSFVAQGGGGIASVAADSSPQLGGDLDLVTYDIVTTTNRDIDLDPNGTGVVVFKGNATKGAGQFKLNCENNSHGITIKGPPHSAAASYTLTLPNDDGSANQVLKTDGSGVLSWVDQSGGGGGGITTGKAIAMAMVFG
tara:strand:+ start:87 stop:2276 length:2190 start_codon:yes stop_codon:yes gene_type:complete